MLEVFDLHISVQSGLGLELFASVGLHSEGLSNLQGFFGKRNGEGLLPSQSQALGTLSLKELKRQNAHTDEVASVDSFETLSNDDLHTEKVRSLGSPIP